jgi:rare lipoprotein A
LIAILVGATGPERIRQPLNGPLKGLRLLRRSEAASDLRSGEPALAAHRLEGVSLIQSGSLQERRNLAFLRIVAVVGACACLAACTTSPKKTAWVDPRLDFDEGAKQLADAGTPAPKSARGYVIGKPYQIAGKWYEPKDEPGYDKTGVASWYGPSFHGRLTANGETFDRAAVTAAHPTLPLPSYVRVTNLQNDRSIVVRVNDRGPFSHKRLIDVSERTAELLDFKKRGMAQVRVEYVDRAKLGAGDEAFLLASYRGPAGSADRMTASVEQRDRMPVQIALAAPAVEAVARTKPKPVSNEVAFVSNQTPAAEAGSAPTEAVEALTSPYSADARILMAFETASSQ